MSSLDYKYVERLKTGIIQAPLDTFVVGELKNNWHMLERVWAFEYDIFVHFNDKSDKKSIGESNINTLITPIYASFLDEPFMESQRQNRIVFIGSKEECEEEIQRLLKEGK